MSTNPVLLLAYGNISRGDDGLGPQLQQRLRDHGLASICGHPVRMVEDYQLQIEHVLDMQGCARVIIMDAMQGLETPFKCSALRANRETGYTTHGMTPSTLLDTYQKTLRHEPPPSYLLAIAAEQFELGSGLSPRARDNLLAATAFCVDIFARQTLLDLDRAFSNSQN